MLLQSFLGDQMYYIICEVDVQFLYGAAPT